MANLQTSISTPGTGNGSSGFFIADKHPLPKQRRVTVKQLQAEVHETIERLLTFLDTLEPDPDLEPDADLEPCCEDEGAQVDEEYELGWTSGINQAAPGRWSGGDYEVDDADREPSLSLPETGSGTQHTGASSGDSADLELDDEREPDDGI